MLALRIRASMSAIGSVMVMGSPRRLRHAGDLSLVRELTETDATERESLEHGALAPATDAARVTADPELPPGSLLLLDQCLLRHTRSLFLFLSPWPLQRSPRPSRRTGTRGRAGVPCPLRRPVPWSRS